MVDLVVVVASLLVVVIVDFHQKLSPNLYICLWQKITLTTHKLHQHSTHLKPIAVVLRCQTKILQHLRDRFFFDAVQVFSPCSKSQITPVTNGTIVIYPTSIKATGLFHKIFLRCLHFQFQCFLWSEILFYLQNKTELY